MPTATSRGSNPEKFVGQPLWTGEGCFAASRNHRRNFGGESALVGLRVGGGKDVIIRFAANDRAIRVRQAGDRRGIDLGIAAATDVAAINIVTDNARRRTGAPCE